MSKNKKDKSAKLANSADKPKKKKQLKASKPSDDVERIDGTIVPVAFRSFLDQITEFFKVNHKNTVSTCHDGDDIIFTIPRQCSSPERIALFMNKSRTWKPLGEFENVTIDKWHTGDVRISVSSDKKSIEEAVGLCKLWKNEKPSFRVGKTSNRPKTDDTIDEDKTNSNKIKTKKSENKSEDKTEKKVKKVKKSKKEKGNSEKKSVKKENSDNGATDDQVEKAPEAQAENVQ